jgi:hypothetical protein
MNPRPVLLLLALAASSLAWGQAPDEPERIARLSYAEGAVTFQGDAESPTSTLPERPLRPGDRLATGRGGRAELALGTATLRLDEDTELSVIDLEAAAFRVEFSTGTATVHLRELFEDESFELITPNATIALQTAGEYRVDVQSDEATALTVRHGVAEVATAGGPVRVADGQRVRLAGRDVVAQLTTPLPADAFEDWVLEREVQLAEAEPPVRDEALDDYGEWYEEPTYGRVWMPSYAYGGYDPFRYGHWQQIGFGWSWYDPMPWGAYTYHHGRWAYLDHLNRWCWVPSRRDHGRHVAYDTRPYRQPTNDRPRDSNPRHDNNERPAATSAALPLRLGADRPTVFGRAAQPAKPARGQAPAPTSAYAPAPAQAPRANRDPSPPPQSAPASSGGTTTMRPAQAAPTARSAAPSTPVNSNKSREFGTIKPP